MAAKKKKVTTQKVKKKKWFPIVAPQMFNNAPLGESYVAESALLVGRYITANLSTITKSMRKQNVNMHFRIINVEDDKAYTEVIGYSLINAAMKRLVRRGRDKIADSFLAKTKEKKVLRIKPLVVTMSKGTHSSQTAIRLEARRVIREYVFSKTVEELMGDIADAKLQKLVKEACTKIAPLRSVDVRKAILVENLDVVITEDGVKTESVTIRKKERGEDLRTEKEKKARQLPDDQFADSNTQEDASLDEESADDDSSENFGDEDQSQDYDDSYDDSSDDFGDEEDDGDNAVSKKSVTVQDGPPSTEDELDDDSPDDEVPSVPEDDEESSDDKKKEE